MEKNGLYRLYGMLDTDTVKKIARKKIKEYYTLVESERIAAEVMAKHDRVYDDRLAARKSQYGILAAFVEDHNIDLGLDSEYDVRTTDVLKRLSEQEFFELGDMQKETEKCVKAGVPDAIENFRALFQDIQIEYEYIKNDLLDSYEPVREEGKGRTLRRID